MAFAPSTPNIERFISRDFAVNHLGNHVNNFWPADSQRGTMSSALFLSDEHCQ